MRLALFFLLLAVLAGVAAFSGLFVGLMALIDLIFFACVVGFVVLMIRHLTRGKR